MPSFACWRHSAFSSESKIVVFFFPVCTLLTCCRKEACVVKVPRLARLVLQLHLSQLANVAVGVQASGFDLTPLVGITSMSCPLKQTKYVSSPALLSVTPTERFA